MSRFVFDEIALIGISWPKIRIQIFLYKTPNKRLQEGILFGSKLKENRFKNRLEQQKSKLINSSKIIISDHFSRYETTQITISSKLWPKNPLFDPFSQSWRSPLFEVCSVLVSLQLAFSNQRNMYNGTLVSKQLFQQKIKRTFEQKRRFCKSYPFHPKVSRARPRVQPRQRGPSHATHCFTKTNNFCSLLF